MTAADGTQTVRFTVGLPPVGLRRNRETRSHNYRAALVREYQEQVWIGAWNDPATNRFLANGDRPWDRAHVSLVWKHHRMGPDQDNALSSLKALLDVLHSRSPRPLGIVVDDSPAHMTVELRTQKVRSKAEEGILVTIVRVESK